MEAPLRPSQGALGEGKVMGYGYAEFRGYCTCHRNSKMGRGKAEGGKMMDDMKRYVTPLSLIALGLYSVILTGWPNDIFNALMNDYEIGSTAGFFAASNLAGAAFVFFYFAINDMRLGKGIMTFVLTLSFISLNGLPIFFLFKFSAEFASLANMYYPIALLGLFMSLSGAAFLAFGVMLILRRLQGSET